MNRENAKSIVDLMIFLKNQNRPDWYKQAIFYMHGQIFSSIYKIGVGNIEEHKHMVLGFYVDILNKVQQSLPELKLKEMSLGRVLRASALFAPFIPNPDDYLDD